MAKVYVVSQGTYSDWSITGIFSTWEKADQFIRDNYIECYNGYNDIKEWTLDEKEEYTTKTLYRCEMDLKNGAIISEDTHPASCGKRVTEVGNTSTVVWTYSSVSQEHARKLAAEKRQEVLRIQALRCEPGGWTKVQSWQQSTS